MVVGGARSELDRLLAAMADRLDTQLEGLLAADRFAEGRAALVRLGAAEHRSRLADLEPEDAAWLAAELRRRWGRVGEAIMEPHMWIEEDPGAGPGVRLTVRVDGLEEGWTVAWSGAESDGGDGVSASVDAQAPQVTARVMGRGPGGRVILTATWQPEGGADPPW